MYHKNCKSANETQIGFNKKRQLLPTLISLEEWSSDQQVSIVRMRLDLLLPAIVNFMLAETDSWMEMASFCETVCHNTKLSPVGVCTLLLDDHTTTGDHRAGCRKLTIQHSLVFFSKY